jgi:hypothetical protein
LDWMNFNYRLLLSPRKAEARIMKHNDIITIN